MIDMLGVVMLQRQHHECHWYHLLISKWLSSATAQGSASLPYALTSARQGPRGMSSMRCAESRSVLAAACRSVMEDAERRCHRRPPEAATGPCRSVPRAPQRKLWLGVQLCRRPSAQCRLRDSRPSRRGGLLITLINIFKSRGAPSRTPICSLPPASRRAGRSRTGRCWRCSWRRPRPWATWQARTTRWSTSTPGPPHPTCPSTPGSASAQCKHARASRRCCGSSKGPRLLRAQLSAMLMCVWHARETVYLTQPAGPDLIKMLI